VREPQTGTHPRALQDGHQDAVAEHQLAEVVEVVQPLPPACSQRGHIARRCRLAKRSSSCRISSRCRTEWVDPQLPHCPRRQPRQWLPRTPAARRPPRDQTAQGSHCRHHARLERRLQLLRQSSRRMPSSLAMVRWNLDLVWQRPRQQPSRHLELDLHSSRQPGWQQCRQRQARPGRRLRQLGDPRRLHLSLCSSNTSSLIPFRPLLSSSVEGQPPCPPPPQQQPSQCPAS
jgi:hypothetical protein